MTETYTNQTKNSSTFSDVNRTGFALWGDPVVTWGDAIYTWGSNITSYTNGTKDASTFTNLTKN